MGQKSKAVFEVLLFLITLILVMAIIDIIIDPIYACWLKKAFMILLSVSVIVAKRKHKEYGLIPYNIRLSIKWGFVILIIFVAPAAVVLAILNKTVEYPDLLVDFIWFMIFVGFAEEIAFRGYIQSRLNECFTKTYNSFIGFKVRWHEGTLITGALIFGPIHLLNAINFRTGEISISLALVFIVIGASFFGVLFGILREISGDVILCSILHGIIDFVAISLCTKICEPLYWVPLAVSFFIFFGLIFERLLGDFHTDR